MSPKIFARVFGWTKSRTRRQFVAAAGDQTTCAIDTPNVARARASISRTFYSCSRAYERRAAALSSLDARRRAPTAKTTRRARARARASPHPALDERRALVQKLAASAHVFSSSDCREDSCACGPATTKMHIKTRAATFGSCSHVLQTSRG